MQCLFAQDRLPSAASLGRLRSPPLCAPLLFFTHPQWPLATPLDSTSAEKCGQRQPARSLLREMWVTTMVPPVLRSYIVSTSACEKCGQWQPAWSLLREMWVAKLAPLVHR